MAFQNNYKKRKIILLSLILVFLAFGLFYVDRLENIKKQKVDENMIIWEVQDKEISLELAATKEKQYEGLSNRESLCPNCGMLFVFPELKQRSFVMRDMNFPLDIIFIQNDEIIKIHHNLPPDTSDEVNAVYSSIEPVNYAIELNAGQASALGLKEGQKIKISEIEN